MLAAVVGIAAFARFHEIGRRSLWFDEGATLGMVRLPLGEFLREGWRSVELNNQILYYLVLRPWHHLGESEATLRSFSALFSTCAVALTCALGRRLFGTAAGVAAAAVLSIHWLAIGTAQEARSYGLTVFLVTLAALFLERVVASDRRRDVVGWSLASGLALYAHFFAIFPVFAQVISLPLAGRGSAVRRRPVAAGALAILACALPIVVFLLGAPPGLLRWVPPVDAARLIQVGAHLSGGKSYLLVFHLVLFAVALVRGLGESRPARRWGVSLVLLWATFPPVAMAAISLRHPILIERYVSMSLPAWALVAGMVLGPLVERRALRALGLGLLAFILVAELDMLDGLYSGPYEDWRTPAAAVAACARPGDAMVYESPWGGHAFGYYLDQSPRRPENLQPGSLLFSGAFDPAEALGRERIWVVLSRDRPGFEAWVHRLLSGSHPALSRRSFGAVRVLLYDVLPRRGPGCSFGAGEALR